MSDFQAAMNIAVAKAYDKGYNDGLEKQGEQILANSAKTCKDEQKPAEEIEPTPIFRIGDILKRKGKDYTFIVDRIQGGYYHCDHNNGAFFPIEEQDKWELVEQKPTDVRTTGYWHVEDVEQKPAEWSEEDEKILDRVITNYESGYLPSVEKRDEIIEKLKSIKGRVQSQPKQGWSEEDERMLKRVIDFIPQCMTAQGYNEYINWFKALKERVQPKQEWSEEDESIYNAILDTVNKDLGLIGVHRDWFKNIKYRLKSLRPRSQWKPSEEQMKALRAARAIDGVNHVVLASLIYDLEKLTE